MSKQLTVNDLKKEIRRMDPNLKPTDESFDTAVILLASTIVGPNVLSVSRYTGIATPEVAKRAKNFRESKVWSGKKVRAGEWFDKDGGIAFWLDVSVGDGMLRRT